MNWSYSSIEVLLTFLSVTMQASRSTEKLMFGSMAVILKFYVAKGTRQKVLWLIHSVHSKII